jgi:hypothetical protein
MSTPTAWFPHPLDASCFFPFTRAHCSSIFICSVAVCEASWQKLCCWLPAEQREHWAESGLFLCFCCLGPLLTLRNFWLCILNAMPSKEDRSEASFIVVETREHAQLLHEWRMAQVKRECNSIAHDLVHLARRSAQSVFWLVRAPACVTDQVNSECNTNGC